ncbi:hypothetical protein BIY22_13575 [Vibrio panuliri]|uniref:N-acetyltransferase domain-containing protein n=1 Tax=Vibrio panuliri TaxID=1381081 RepID=A0A1Q9HA55_9VIBR|nr:GNAT family N-acetyltransferase [Vibrio panuliri]OLQ85909.1 hypothetical protein BIY22_13575 [Vibrio panuliri]
MMLKTLSFEQHNFMPSVERALVDDPLYVLLSDSELQRQKLINIFSSRILNSSDGVLSGFYIGDNLDAAVIWNDLRSEGHYSRLKALKLQFRMLTSGSIGRIGQLQNPLQQMEANIAKLKSGCDSYLELLFVKKSMRGMGLSSALVYPQLQCFDQQQRVCGLDTFNPANIPIYQKFGFELVSQVEFGSGVANYQMMRHPNL